MADTNSNTHAEPIGIVNGLPDDQRSKVLAYLTNDGTQTRAAENLNNLLNELLSLSDELGAILESAMQAPREISRQNSLIGAAKRTHALAEEAILFIGNAAADISWTYFCQCGDARQEELGVES